MQLTSYEFETLRFVVSDNADIDGVDRLALLDKLSALKAKALRKELRESKKATAAGNRNQ